MRVGGSASERKPAHPHTRTPANPPGGSVMDYQEWEHTVPEQIKRGPLWSFDAYRLALFLYELAWMDCETLMQDTRGRAVAQQLIRSAGSICANIEEGYGRGYGKEYAYFLRVSIGSSRETQGWYFRCRRLLPDEVLQHRLNLLDTLIGKLVLVQTRQRQK